MRGAVRIHARLCADANLSLEEAQLVLAALHALRGAGSVSAARALIAVCEEHALTAEAGVLRGGCRGRGRVGGFMVFATAALYGALRGLAGVTVMTLGEKLEQRLTGRPNSYVPARTLARLLSLNSPDDDRWTRNMAMHYGTGALAGTIRGVMSAANLRGPLASRDAYRIAT